LVTVAETITAMRFPCWTTATEHATVQSSSGRTAVRAGREQTP